MERLSVARTPLVWRVATVRQVVEENAHARTIALEVSGWPGHTAGQHVDVRLTADDGYQAQRSYSIASGPQDPWPALTVERIEDGEVSPYLAGELRAGDQFELRGPVGGHFVWRAAEGGPLLLVAGGSGLVPLMSILRHHAAQGSKVDARLLVSARSEKDLLYRAELSRQAEREAVQVHYTLTRAQPAGWTGFTRRLDADMLAAVGPSPAEQPKIFVCGPTSFVELAADLLVELGHRPTAIRAERFGPTGG